MEFLESRPRLLAALTWWPLVYMGLFMLVWLVSFFGMALAPVAFAIGESVGGDTGAALTGGLVTFGGVGLFALIVPLHLFTMVEMLAMTAFYILHVVRNEALDSNQRMMWVVICLFAGIVGQLIYLYLQVRPEAELRLAESGAL